MRAWRTLEEALCSSLYTLLDEARVGGGRGSPGKKRWGRGTGLKKAEKMGLSCHFPITTLCLPLVMTVKKTPTFVKSHSLGTFLPWMKTENDIMCSLC